MIGNHNYGVTFELRGLPGMDEVARNIVALLSLAGKICADLLKHDLQKNFGWVD